jgi:DNA-directed RNA polymerase, mitochondrial
MAKVIPNYLEAIKYLNRVDMSSLCNVLDVLGSTKWRLNLKILEIIEYIWSIGGGLGEVPKRFNERLISPEMIKAAEFREKLKLLKEHQHNKENHSLRCEFLLRLQIS